MNEYSTVSENITDSVDRTDSAVSSAVDVATVDRGDYIACVVEFPGPGSGHTSNNELKHCSIKNINTED